MQINIIYFVTFFVSAFDRKIYFKQTTSLISACEKNQKWPTGTQEQSDIPALEI
jgi:hypothetical protein